MFRRAAGQEKFVRVIYVDSTGTFSSKLPQEVHQAFGGAEEVTGTTLVAVEREYDALLAKFGDSLKTVTKVILYDLKYNDGYTRSDGTAIHFCSGVAVALQASVCEETLTTNLDGTTSYSYEGLASTIPSAMSYGSGHHGGSLAQHYGREMKPNRLPWTEEGEAFFASVCSAMLGLIAKLQDMTATPETLQAFVESRQPLLLPTTKQVQP